jgi:hypothetical protein
MPYNTKKNPWRWTARDLVVSWGRALNSGKIERDTAR